MEIQSPAKNKPDAAWSILIIDDDEEDFLIAREMLREAAGHAYEAAGRAYEAEGRAYDVHWAATYDAGRAELLSGHYDAVLVDYDLGLRSGIELIREATGRGCPAPLILFTGRGNYEVDHEAMQAGATLYLTKREANPLLLERSIRYAIERKRVEVELRESDRRLSVALDAAKLGTWTYTFDDHVFEGDARAQQMYRAGGPRVDHDDLVRRLLPPEDVPAMQAALQKAADPTGDGRYHAEYRILQPDGSARWLNAWGQAEFEGQGADRRAVRLIGASRDITWEKQAALDLAASNAAVKEMAGRFQEVLEGALDAAYRRDLRTDRYDYMSPVIEQIFGLTADEMMQMGIQEALSRIHPDDQPAVEAGLARSEEQGRARLVYRYLCKDGKYRWISDYVTVTRDAEGRPIYRTGVVRDVTGEVLAQQALRESEERFRLASRAVNGVLYDLTLGREHVFQSEGLERVVGYKPGEEPGGSTDWWPRNIHPDDSPRVQAELQAAIDSQRDSYAYEYRIRHKDGHWVHIWDQGYIVRDAYGRAQRIVGMCSDISDRVRAEAELKERNEALIKSEKQLRRLVDANIIGINIRDAAGNIRDANDTFLNMVGYTCDDLTSGALNLQDITPPAYQEADRAAIQEALATGSCRPYEKEYLHRDGRAIPAMVGYTRLDEDDERFIGYVLDLSELKQAQAGLQEYADKLQRSNQELEQFAFVASHDLQEPLRKIIMFGESLRRHSAADLDEAAVDYMSRMENAATRMQAMINGLLDLSRVNRRGGEFAPVDLNALMREVVGDLEPRIQSVKGQVEVGPLPAVDGDEIQLRRLFQNLIGNALKFHKPDQPPIVRVSCAALPNRKTPQVEIRVADNGIGLESQYAGRIFQPFQRLHGRSDYEGTGLGLAICQKIVERHHGSITVESAPDQGAVFIVKLPAKQ